MKTLWATSIFALRITFSLNFSFSVAPSNIAVSCRQHVPRELNVKEEHAEKVVIFSLQLHISVCTASVS